MKKHQKRYAYANYQRTFFKHLLKKIFEPIKENPNIVENCADKVTNVVQLLVQ